jgi:hypothetical protein
MFKDESPIDSEAIDNTGEIEEIEPGEKTEEYYLRLATAAYDESETFIERGIKERWARNNALAKSEHPPGSKYYSKAYEHRSKNFRGKTEGSIRKNEAALSVAMFSNRDVVSITAENQDGGENDKKAKAIHQVTNYRLDNDINWFLTSVGAYHEAMINGDVVSEQNWQYEKIEKETGETVVLLDKPDIDLIPLELFHVSPSANWRDPINTSPYIVIEIPMFICDIKEMMVEGKELDDLDPGEWLYLSESQLQAATKTAKHDVVQQAREGTNNPTKNDTSVAVTGFELVYVRKNTIRVDGEDMFFHTLGDRHVISKPIPLREQYKYLKHGQRPWVWGTATIEPHKIYRRSLVDRCAGTQIQSNDIANQRMDNVVQVLNKRKVVQRNMGVDYATLLRNVPGSLIMTDSMDAIREEPVTDITSSSYQEQHMINADFDELAGSFSNSSVTTNRAMNDTVGGMQLLKGDSNTLTEYQLRVFVETWVEPVIRQVVDMVMYHEDDAIISQVTDGEIKTNADLQTPVKVRVSVGFGSTDPQQNVNKIVFGVNAVTQNLPGLQGKLNETAIAEEIFSALGFNDGKKFLPEPQQEGQDPEKEAMVQQLQQMQQIIESKMTEEEGKTQRAVALENLKAQNSMKELYIKLVADRQLKLTELSLAHGIKKEELLRRSGMDESKMNLELLKETNRRMDIESQKAELQFKRSTGRDGI